MLSEQFELHDLPGGGVGIPYRDASGRAIYVKKRMAVRAGDGSYVPRGQKQMPYGLERLTAARDSGRLVLVEGESDVWTLAYHGYGSITTDTHLTAAMDSGRFQPTAVLGIPGARAVKTLQPWALQGIERVYAVEEHDDAGKAFIAGLRERLTAARFPGQFFAVRLPCKDVNELHKRDPDGFKAAFEAALLEAMRSHEKHRGETSQETPGEDTPGDGECGSKALVAVDIHDFLALTLPPREKILSPWLLSQSLSMIYSWRGVGKTYLGLSIAYATACGGEVLGWNADKPRKVLYVDGEMPGIVLQERLAAIAAAADHAPEPGFFRIITPDLQPSFIPDLATLEGQASLNALIGDSEVVHIDNLSCLARRGGPENDAESWLVVAEWALAHRARGRSIVFYHHANKLGQQRGTSKREDLLDTVICLKRPPNYDPADGAVFEVRYEKARGMYGEDTAPFEAKLTTDAHGGQAWVTRTLAESTLDRVVEMANEGMSQSAIAKELDLNRSTVSRAWTRAVEQGLIKPKGRDSTRPRRDIDD
jgi:hypothetical protein